MSEGLELSNQFLDLFALITMKWASNKNKHRVIEPLPSSQYLYYFVCYG